MQNVKHHRCQENRTDIDPDMTTWQSYQTDLSLWNRTSPQLLILYIYTHTNHHTNKYIKNNLTLMIYFRLQKCPNSIGARLSADHSHPVWSWTVGCHSGMWHIDSGRNLKLDPLLPVSYLPHVDTVRGQTSYWRYPIPTRSSDFKKYLWANSDSPTLKLIYPINFKPLDCHSYPE